MNQYRHKYTKINILFNFKKSPWGGGNQFLKALRGQFLKLKVYEENPGNADVILFNSHHNLKDALRLKDLGRIIIHRVDGPVSYYRSNDKQTDRLIIKCNNLLADGTIFQSKWSKNAMYDIGYKKNNFETIIINASDSEIFNRKGKDQFFQKRKMKLITTSWSGNIRKGFDIYKFLDEHLDFNRYEMTFIGNSPVQFENIKWIKPVPSRDLAETLKKHDIYVIASRNDPCSNALIEALHCGLPAVARNDGGHPEIIGEAGEFFEDEKDVIGVIEKVAQDYRHYQTQIKLPTIEEVAKKYYEFAQRIYEDYLNGSYYPKQISFFNISRVRIKILEWKILNKLQAVLRMTRHKA